MRRFTLIVFLLALLASHAHSVWQSRPSDQLTITMLDIGQGDAIYIRTPQGNDILIDGGPDEKLLAELGSTMPHGDTKIELVIATHPDADHIGGLESLGRRWTVGTLLVSGARSNNPLHDAYLEWESTVQAKQVALVGNVIQVEPELSLTILHPDGSTAADVNDQSVVVLLRYKEFTALFTGDAGIKVEELFSDNQLIQELDLLKVSHHGSKTGTSQELLAATTPKIALISAGKSNSYGHPHAQVMHRLEQFEVAVFRTDLQGRVTCVTNGGVPSCTGADM